MSMMFEASQRTIEELQQENQALRESLKLAHARLDNTLKDWPADVKDSTIQQLQQENQAMREHAAKGQEALRKDLEHLKKAEIAFREIISQQDCLIDEQKAGLTRLREALKEIADHEHCRYEKNESGQYGIGVTDGHRCAAIIAREVLAPQEGKQE